MTNRGAFIAAVVPALFLSFTVCASAMDFDAETVYESVVVVYAGNTVGSGFAAGEHCVITNAHVVADSARVNISTDFGNEFEAFVASFDSFPTTICSSKKISSICRFTSRMSQTPSGTNAASFSGRTGRWKNFRDSACMTRPGRRSFPARKKRILQPLRGTSKRDP